MESHQTGRKGMGGKDDLDRRRPNGFSPAAWPKKRPTAADILTKKPRELCDAVIRLQRVRGPSRRQDRRGRSAASLRTEVRRKGIEVFALRRLRPIHAASNPLTVFPSLRAHKPNPAARGPSGPGRLLHPWKFSDLRFSTPARSSGAEAFVSKRRPSFRECSSCSPSIPPLPKPEKTHARSPPVRLRFG